jgi:ABC-type protease/lipase transport system fused ATPase/permease subunit
VGGWMKVKQPDFAAVMSLVWWQAPALLVFSFLANLLLVIPVYTLQACNDVLPSGALDTLWWLTLAALVAIHRRFSPHASSNRSGLSISAR